MRVGIDFDNTIVRYDGVFHAVALERGAIPADLPVHKERVRDHLRAGGREDLWTEMQGYVYGLRMADAEPFPGVLEFLARCRERGVEVAVISHKTRVPYLGPPYDLHAAALDWMRGRGLFEAHGIGLTRERVFLEPTKRDKLARIAAVGCTHFIDDLPEFLEEPDFPAGVQRLLFAPQPLARGCAFPAFSSWDEIARTLLDRTGPEAG